MAKERTKNQTGKADFHSFRMAVNRMLFEGYKTDSDKGRLTDQKLLNVVIRNHSGSEMIREDKLETTKKVIRQDFSDIFCDYLYGAFCLHSVQQSSSAAYPALVMQLLSQADEPMSCNRIQDRLAKKISIQMADSSTADLRSVHSQLLQEDKQRIRRQRGFSEQDFRETYKIDPDDKNKTPKCNEGKKDTPTFKLTSVVKQLHQQGFLQTVPNEKSTARYRLAPPIPLGIPGEPEQTQLQRAKKLYMLLNLLSERVMPQTLGYHCRSALDLLLQQHGVDPDQIRYPLVIKRDSRPRLMVDDEILWSLLSAHGKNQWVQVEFLSFQNQHSLSVPLQPLFIQTFPGEGRHYLAARPQDQPDLLSCRPVVLPLDRIIRVHTLSVSPRDFSAEESQYYMDRWFAHSFSGMSPAQEDLDGNPAAPYTVEVYRKPHEGTDIQSWVERLKGRCCLSADPVGDTYLFRYLVTRPEDLEPILMRDTTVTAVNTPGSDFALRFHQRSKVLKAYGSLTPHPWVEILYPPIQKDMEPLAKDDQTALFSPWYNWQLRSTMEEINSWIRDNRHGWKELPITEQDPYARPILEMYEAMCLNVKFPLWNAKVTLWDPKNQKQCLRYTPYFQTPIPARFTYPEMDWLECFLSDSMVTAILGETYCGYLRDYLLKQLEVGAAQVGYRRRFEKNGFIRLNTWGRHNPQLSSFRDIPLDKLVEALTDHHPIDFENHTKGNGVKFSQNVVPIRLEYMPGARRLRLMLYNPEEDRFFIASCANMKNIRVHPETLPPEKWEEYEALFSNYLKATEKARTLTLSNDPVFLQRAYGVLQPYLDTITTDDNGAVEITLKYQDFERFHLNKIQELLFPGVPLPEAPTI